MMNLRESILFAITLFSVTASAQRYTISVADAQFSKPLMEKLITEYNQREHSLGLEIVSNGDADAKVTLSYEPNTDTFGRFVVLPIANASSQLLGNKKVHKGLNNKLEKQLFVQLSYEETLDNKEKPLSGTIYSQIGSKAFATNLFAKKLSVAPKKIKGKKILGSEQNVLTVVQKNSDAVSFNIANVVYDIDSRKPVKGIVVLPVDLDNNDKVSDEERNALSNLDILTSYLNNVPSTSLPVGNLCISSNNEHLRSFIHWISTEGQAYLKEYGYLKAPSKYIAQK